MPETLKLQCMGWRAFQNWHLCAASAPAWGFCTWCQIVLAAQGKSLGMKWTRSVLCFISGFGGEAVLPSWRNKTQWLKFYLLALFKNQWRVRWSGSGTSVFRGCHIIASLKHASLNKIWCPKVEEVTGKRCFLLETLFTNRIAQGRLVECTHEEKEKNGPWLSSFSRGWEMK